MSCNQGGRELRKGGVETQEAPFSDTVTSRVTTPLHSMVWSKLDLRKEYRYIKENHVSLYSHRSYPSFTHLIYQYSILDE